MLTKRNTALAASLASASINTPAPLSVATIANTFTAPPRYQYRVDWAVSGLKLDLTSGPIGGRVNSRKAIRPLPALITAGALDVALEATVNGASESEVFATSLAGRGAGMAGCSLALRARTRDFFLDCSKAKIDLPAFSFQPKARARAARVCGAARRRRERARPLPDGGGAAASRRAAQPSPPAPPTARAQDCCPNKSVVAKLAVTATKLTASAPISDARVL